MSISTDFYNNHLCTFSNYEENLKIDKIHSKSEQESVLTSHLISSAPSTSIGIDCNYIVVPDDQTRKEPEETPSAHVDGPTNRIDAICEALPYLSTGLNELVKIVINYDDNPCNSIISALQGDLNVSKDVLSIAESITVLDLKICTHRISNPAILSFFKHIEILTVPSYIKGDALKYVGIFKDLRELNLNDCDNITDTDLAPLANLTSLTSLDLKGCWRITAILTTLTTLKSLNLCKCTNIGDSSLASIANFSDLESLNLNGCWSITNAGLEYLKNLKNLTSLSLTICNKITDTGLVSLINLTALTSLDLSNCDKITDLGIDSLKALVSLQSIILKDCNKITDKSLSILASIKTLTFINLKCTKITVDGLIEAAKINPLLKCNM